MSDPRFEIQKGINDLVYAIRLYERQFIISEIQAFAGEYSHPMTKDDVTRDVLIVEQLIDFLKTPQSTEGS
jgi:hypothetical protein